MGGTRWSRGFGDGVVTVDPMAGLPRCVVVALPGTKSFVERSLAGHFVRSFFSPGGLCWLRRSLEDLDLVGRTEQLNKLPCSSITKPGMQGIAT